MTSSTSLLLLHPNDNVAVAKEYLSEGSAVLSGDRTLTALASIPPGHKIAIAQIGEDAPIVKYGQVIGYAMSNIGMGDWVHVHNVKATKPGQDYAFSTELHEPPKPASERFFNGYRRANGSAGTRNYVAVISTVNCSATTAKYVARELTETDLSEYPNIDGVVAFVHKEGCALAFNSDDHRQLNRTMAGFAKHPNIVACIVLGLGCETAQATVLERDHNLVQLGGVKDADEPPPMVLNIQEVGGVRKTVAKAVSVLRDLLPLANDVAREPIPINELKIAMECGGSDGNSGITANPAVGVASDLLVAHGATTILSETTELYGAEHLLTRRAVTPEVGEQLLERIRWWENYARRYDASIDNNPSVGNKNGGLTTIFEKSLGAVSKGGTSPLRAVYQYAEPITEKGFVIMDSPGFDPASITGKVASGAQVVVFTTGRGSCFGCKPSPTIKVATNTPMFNRMKDDMDINAGTILDGSSIEEVGEEIFERIIATASGQATLSEAQGIGDEEFCPWFPGPIF
ncbi:MAG: altronate dehydratase [Fuerstiella sp.]|nr:altronate dehydratase [Fuerstiella sp.]MCP4512098.1 altronate dehydratase [Fuerstiella sp.]MDG2128103.1 altronate dehydratase family protein [Fuerstiella sp.]